MPTGIFAFVRRVWDSVDGRLARVAGKLRSLVRTLRILAVLLVIGIIAVLASAVVGIWWPEYFPYAYAVSTVVLLVPVIGVLTLIMLPLRMKSVIRLIEKGYPGNARELAIRVAVRKVRDQSIETEEMLVETALNESRKALERYRERAERLQQEKEAPPASAAEPSLT